MKAVMKEEQKVALKDASMVETMDTRRVASRADMKVD